MKNKKIAKQKKKSAKTEVKTIRKVSGNNKLVLKFSPTAWAKLLYFRDKSGNEVGGFGITGPEDLLYVTDFITVKQDVTPVSVKFDDRAVADFFDDQVDLGRKPEQFARIWLHTHPGMSADPSMIDEETFKRVFGSCQWAVMFIVSHDNETRAELSFNVGPGGRILIPVEVDYSRQFCSSNWKDWDAEYQANVRKDRASNWMNNELRESVANQQSELEIFGCEGSQEYMSVPYDSLLLEIDAMHPVERNLFLEELASHSSFWDESEVFYE